MQPRGLCAVALGLAMAAASSAQGKNARGPSASKPSIPLFTAASRLVQVPVIVDRHGSAVNGLMAADFSVSDNGKPEAIRFFTATAAAAAPAPAVVRPAASSGTAFGNTPTAEEARQPHPIVVILLDDLNSTLGMETSQNQPAFFQGGAFHFASTQLIHFVRELPAEDRVAVYGLSDKLTLLSDFSSDRKQLLAAIQAFKPVSNFQPGMPADSQSTGVPGAFDSKNAQAGGTFAGEKAMDNGRLTMLALRAIANHLALLPGRVSLVWLTADPAVAGEAVAAALGTDKIAVYPVDARGLLTREALQAKSMCDCFPLSGPQMVAWLNAQLPGQNALRDIARQTGGEAFVNTNDIAGAIRRAAQDSETSYTLGFYVESSDLDNTFHHIQVKVRGSGLQARYPRGYWALADNSPLRPRLNAMDMAVASPEDAAGIGIHATARRLAGSKPVRYEISGAIDLRGVALAQVNGLRTGTLVVALAEQNAAGAVLWRGSHAFPMHLDDANYARLLKGGLAFEMTVKAETAAATLRLIVEDPASGSTGSLIMPLDQMPR